MTDQTRGMHDNADVAPGDEEEVRIGARLLGYAIGLHLLR